MARKYRFHTRIEAEASYLRADQQRVYTEWFASALLNGQTKTVGIGQYGSRKTVVGHFGTPNCSFVFALHEDSTLSNRIAGVWLADGEELRNNIASLLRYEDSHEFGRLLDRARTEAFREAMAA